MTNNNRQLTDWEQQVLDKLLETDFPGRKELQAQARHAVASPTGDPDNYGSIYLITDQKNSAPVTSRVPVEAIGYDEDGGAVQIILHVAEGYLHELEVFKYDGTPIKQPPSPESLVVNTNNY